VVIAVDDIAKELKQYRATRATWKVLAQLVEKCTCLEGRHDKGKSMSLVAIAYWLREWFGRPVITIESTMGLKPAFGPHKHLPVKAFVDELKKLTEVAKIGQNGHQPEELQDAINEALKKMGIDLMYATLVFDEANKLFEARRPHDPLVLLVGYFVQQMAHYHNTVLIATPNRRAIDYRVREQVDFWGRPHYDEITKVCQLDFFKLSPERLMTLRIQGERYFDLYDRWSLVAFRSKSLNIKEAYL